MSKPLDKPLRISELEELTGINRRTIHYYLDKGLLTPPRRTGKTMAYYGSVNVEELREIRRLRDEGYPVSLIREMMPGRMEVIRPAPEAESGARSGRKQQIMDKAVELFARKGYNQTKISEITAAVGVGQSTFYLYFPNKKVLFLECVNQVFQAMFEDVWEEIRHEKHPLRRLRKRAEVIMKCHPQFIDMLQVLRMAVDDDPSLEARRKEIYTSVVETVKGDVVKAVELGLIHPMPGEMDTGVLSYILVGFLETAFLIMRDQGYTVDELLDAVEIMPHFQFRQPTRK
ncbi:MAG: MerR family transcriptional regulator [Actinobacteria bacterium]|jgi:AcrR family transcriptional regulator|nr:MAG: MerR family transcriptional regulator [Actinomycetota bacterium]